VSVGGGAVESECSSVAKVCTGVVSAAHWPAGAWKRIHCRADFERYCLLLVLCGLSCVVPKLFFAGICNCISLRTRTWPRSPHTRVYTHLPSPLCVLPCGPAVLPEGVAATWLCVPAGCQPCAGGQAAPQTPHGQTCQDASGPGQGCQAW